MQALVKLIFELTFNHQPFVFVPRHHPYINIHTPLHNHFITFVRKLKQSTSGASSIKINCGFDFLKLNDPLEFQGSTSELLVI